LYFIIILKTFGNIIRKDNSIEKDIALRQLAMKGQNSDSWFSKLDEISEKYNLNSPHDLIVNPPTQSSWKILLCNSPTTGIRPIIKYVASLAVLSGRF
jgi:hypothetical protein